MVSIVTYPESRIIFVVRSLLCGVLLFLSHSVYTAPYHGVTMLFRQPDERFVRVIVWGDEYYQRVESTDGYPLVRNASGWICYALLNIDRSDWVSTDIIYHELKMSDVKNQYRVSSRKEFPHLEKGVELRIEGIRKKRTEMAAHPLLKQNGQRHANKSLSAGRTNGSNEIKGITILIDFPDSEHELSTDDVSDFMNKPGYSEFGNNGSVRDYFNDVSGGVVEYTNEVIGYYRAKNNIEYYDTDVQLGRSAELVDEALQWADTQFDFSLLTLSEGKVRAINFLYVGAPRRGWTKGLWPHKGSVQFQADGVELGNYQLSNFSSSLGLAAVCHENGHMLFNWPDLYDYDYNSQSVGNYCLMAHMGSNVNPVPPNAYLRSLEGWENLITLNDTSGVFSLLSNSTQTTYYYRNPARDEFFVLEARLQKGRSASLPDEGLMIWHIDQTMGNNSHNEMTPERHFIVSLEQADGKFELERGIGTLDTHDLFDDTHTKGFSDYTLPNAAWWNGAVSGLNIHAISAPGDTVKITVGDAYNLLASPGSLTAESTQGKVFLTWLDNSDTEDGYWIERKEGSGEFFVIGKAPGLHYYFTDESLDLIQNFSYTYRVRAYNDISVSSPSNDASVKIQGESRSPFDPAQHFPGLLEAEHYDKGGQGTAYFDHTPGNAYWTYRTDAVEIIDASDETGEFCIELDAGEWVAYTVKVAKAGMYALEFRVKADGPAKFFLENSGRKLTEVMTESASEKWITKYQRKIPLSLGSLTFRFVLAAGTLRLNYITALYVSEPEIFPNPAETFISIRHNDISVLGQVHIYSAHGQFSKVFPPGLTQIDLADLPSGLYIAKFHDASGKLHHQVKFIKAP